MIDVAVLEDAAGKCQLFCVSIDKQRAFHELAAIKAHKQTLAARNGAVIVALKREQAMKARQQ